MQLRDGPRFSCMENIYQFAIALAVLVAMVSKMIDPSLHEV